MVLVMAFTSFSMESLLLCCGCVAKVFWLWGYMAMGLYGYGAIWLWGYMAMGLYGYGAIWLWGYMAMGLYGYGAIWLWGYMAMGLYGYGAIWLYFTTLKHIPTWSQESKGCVQFVLYTYHEICHDKCYEKCHAWYLLLSIKGLHFSLPGNVAHSWLNPQPPGCVCPGTRGISCILGLQSYPSLAR